MNQMRRGVAGGSRLPHTPTQSLGDAATEMAARSQAIELKRRDEVDAARSRLSDQKFNIGMLISRLLPKPPPTR